MKKPVRFWKRDGVFYYRLATGNGWRSTGKTSRRAAEQEVDRIRAEARQTTDLGPTFREYSTPFYRPDTDPRAIRKRIQGRRVGLEHLRNSRHWLDEYVLKDRIADMRLRELTRDEMVACMQRLAKRCGDKRSTASKAWETAVAVLREAAWSGLIPFNPAAGLGSIDERRAERGTLSADELRALFPAGELGPWASVVDRGAFLLAATTGMRRGEVLALQWEQVDLEAKTVVVDRAWKKIEGELGPPKSGRARIQPLPAVAVEELRAVLAAAKRTAPSDFVFGGDDGYPRGETWWRARFAAALAKAKIQDQGRGLTPHCLRHSVATLLAAQGVDPGHITAALGWGSEEMRMRYTHLGAEHLRDVADAVGKVLGAK